MKVAFLCKYLYREAKEFFFSMFFENFSILGIEALTSASTKSCFLIGSMVISTPRAHNSCIVRMRVLVLRGV